MDFSGIFARIVALIGGAALLSRRLQDEAPQPAWGNAPFIPAAKPQGAIPTLKMPTAKGWSDGQKPTAAPGLKVNAFAFGPSALDQRAAQWRCPHRRGDAAGWNGQDRVSICNASDHAAGGCARGQCQPYYLVAGPGW